MKYFLQLILIAIVYNIANAATSSGLKTIPVTTGLKTDETLSVKALHSKTTFPTKSTSFPTKSTTFPPKTTATTFPPKSTTTSFPPKSTTTSFPPKSTTTTFPPKSTTTSYPPKSTTTSFPPKSTTTSFPPKSTTTTFPPKSTSTSFPPKSTTTTFPPKVPQITPVPVTTQLDMNYYTTVLEYDGYKVTSRIPVNQKVSITECSSTVLNSDRVIEKCSIIDRTTTKCSSQLTGGPKITRRMCKYSTETLDIPMTVTVSKCPYSTISCVTKILPYETYSSIHETVYIRTDQACSTSSYDIDCVIPVTNMITPPPKTTTTTPSITTPPEITSIVTTPIMTDCPPITVTYTEKETVTIVEKETKTVTAEATPVNDDSDDSQCVGKYAQCGGEGFNGPTCCKNGLTCRRISRYFSQCD